MYMIQPYLISGFIIAGFYQILWLCTTAKNKARDFVIPMETEKQLPIRYYKTIFIHWSSRLREGKLKFPKRKAARYLQPVATNWDGSSTSTTQNSESDRNR